MILTKSIKEAKHTIALLIAIALQCSLRNVLPAAAYVDFPLIVIIYAALQRDAIRAMVYASIGGIAIDALSGGLLGAGGFSKTLTAFVVAEIARRVVLDNPLLRIPVLAGASLLKDVLYFSLHRLLGQSPTSPIVETMAYDVIGTTVAGTILMFTVMYFLSERTKNRRNFFGPKRQTGRRNPIRLGRRAG